MPRLASSEKHFLVAADAWGCSVRVWSRQPGRLAQPAPTRQTLRCITLSRSRTRTVPSCRGPGLVLSPPHGRQQGGKARNTEATPCPHFALLHPISCSVPGLAAGICLQQHRPTFLWDHHDPLHLSGHFLLPNPSKSLEQPSGCLMLTRKLPIMDFFKESPTLA